MAFPENARDTRVKLERHVSDYLSVPCAGPCVKLKLNKFLDNRYRTLSTEFLVPSVSTSDKQTRCLPMTLVHQHLVSSESKGTVFKTNYSRRAGFFPLELE